MGHLINIGSSDDDWQDDGHNVLISDNWDIAKNSRFQTHLHVSTNPLQAIETIIIGAFAAVGVIAFALFASDPKTKCTWGPAVGPQGAGDPQGAGVGLRCIQ